MQAVERDTLSLGLPSELEGEPPAVGGTSTNSSLVTVDTDSVEPLTLPREELSAMIDWDSPPARPNAAATLPTRQTCYTDLLHWVHAGLQDLLLLP